MDFKYFDIHSHLNLDPLTKQQDEIIEILEKENIGTITIGVDKKTSIEAVKIAEKSKNIFAGVGVHPTDTDYNGFDYEFYKSLAQKDRVVCIGECGLDYFRIKDTATEIKDKQKEVFVQQIELALELDLPLMLHCRPTKGTMDAYEDVLEILNSYFLIHNSKLRGNSHFFVGDIGIASQFIDIGFTLSFDGPITFARDYDEVIKYVPLDMIHAETDAPFAAPEPYRGKTNMPQYVKEVVKKIAEIRGEDFETVRRALIDNALRVFSINK